MDSKMELTSSTSTSSSGTGSTTPNSLTESTISSTLSSSILAAASNLPTLPISWKQKFMELPFKLDKPQLLKTFITNSPTEIVTLDGLTLFELACQFEKIQIAKAFLTSLADKGTIATFLEQNYEKSSLLLDCANTELFYQFINLFQEFLGKI